VAGFTDDLTLCGPSDVVAADLDYINSIQGDTGLRINASKSEIISYGSRPRAGQFEGFISETELLGAPLFAGKKMDDLLENRCYDLNTAISCLSLLSAHDAFVPHQRTQSSAHISPCVNHP